MSDHAATRDYNRALSAAVSHQHEPERITSLPTDEIEKRRAPTTPATWAIAALLLAAAAAWIALLVLNLRR